jgi:CDP-diglyceride synthetase
VLLCAFAGTWLGMALPMLITRRPPPLHGMLGAAFAMAFISVPLGLLLILADVAFGAYAFFILLLMAHDGLAEGFGRLLGKRPLWPDISPGKTLGGTLGGIASCLVLGYLLNRVLGIGWELGQVLAVAAGVVLMAAVGDLIASSIKREAGIKDFGKILPAHGGVLDRIDSMLFTLPAFFAAASWLGGAVR